MLLDARLACIYPPQDLLRYAFNTASAKETMALGQAFARVIMQNGTVDFPEGRILRVGLRADMRTGKSTFAGGMLSAFPDKDKIETVDDKFGGHGSPQVLWRNRDGMWLRHCDAGHELKENCLTSYWDNHLETEGSSLNDIVEHPGRDKNDTMFDCIVMISRAFTTYAQERRIEITATQKIAASPGFQAFLQEAADRRIP